VTAPILVLSWGNPSRGDDALGPLFGERIAAMQIPGVECLTDFQLQVEHALDLEGRQLVLFVDASLDAKPPFAIRQLAPAAGADFSTHVLAPEAVLQVHAELHDNPPPPALLLEIRGEAFDLGSGLSTVAWNNLDSACDWTRHWLSENNRLACQPFASH